MLADVPRTQAGTAGGALITAQRLGAAIGIAGIGTALCGSGPGGGGPAGGSGGSGGAGGSGSGGSGPAGSAGGHGGAGAAMPSLVHHAGIATLVNLCFIVAALACSYGLPRRLARDSGEKGKEAAGAAAHDGRTAGDGPGNGDETRDSGQSAA